MAYPILNNIHNSFIVYSLPSNAEFKNEWNDTSILPVCLYGMDGVNFTFTLLFKMTCVSSEMQHSFDRTAVCVGDRRPT